MVIDMPTCANDAVEMASTPTANNSQRMEGRVRIMFPLLPDDPVLYFARFCYLVAGCMELGRENEGTISRRNC
jgi:hypothetical protein